MTAELEDAVPFIERHKGASEGESPETYLFRSGITLGSPPPQDSVGTTNTRARNTLVVLSWVVPGSKSP